MSDFGASPTAVMEASAVHVPAGADAGSSQLAIPATVRSERVIWLYVGTVVTIHLAALAALLP